VDVGLLVGPFGQGRARPFGSAWAMALPSREFLISEVDREFLLQHPAAPRQLDPNDPRQEHLVQQWNAMFHEFLNRMVDSHFYRFFPNAQRLDPNNPADSTLIDYWNDIHDVIGEGKPPRYNWDEHLAHAAETAQTQQHEQGPKPDVGVHMDESQFKEYVRAGLEGTHYVADSAEVLGYLAEGFGAGEESALVVLGETLGPIGLITATITVLWATVEAFGTGRRLQEEEGYCYGVLWEVAGLADAHKSFHDWAGDSAEELRDSFYDGVAAGREKAAWPSVHNRIVLATAYYQASGHDLETARSQILNDMWLHIRETDKGRDYLTWPTPMSMGE
jgi:hypothetical protein